MPDWKPEILRRLAALKLAPTREAEIADELSQHLEDRYQELLASGQSEDAAFRTSLDELKEDDLLGRSLKPVEKNFYREPIVPGQTGTTFFEGILQDIRYGFRMLRKSPGFTLVAILTLALGIGANTAIFSVVNAVLLRPLPFPQSSQLVSVESFNTINKIPLGVASYPDFFDLRSQNQVFTHVASFHNNSYTLTGVDQPAHLSGATVSSGFLSTLEVSPELGRDFLPAEEKQGNYAAILSDRLWRTIFHADPAIVGHSILLNNQNYTVVGVAPREFNFPITTPPVQIWTTCADDTEMLADRGVAMIQVIARMKPGVAVPQAQADIAHIYANLAKQYPNTNLQSAGAFIEPELQHLVGDVEPALFVLFGAVGCVLLIACANVANLLLARSMTRQKELAIRSALGAGRFRVIRQLLTESILLALFGAALGLLFALWGTRTLVQLVPHNVPRMTQIQVDSRVFAFTLIAAVITGILFGLAPALQTSKTNLVDSLKDSGRGLSGGLQQNRLRSTLVIVEVALALALLMGAGLMIQSFARLQTVNPGFNSGNVLTFTFDLPKTKYNTNQQKIFYRQALDRLNQIPGVASAAAALLLPLSGGGITDTFTIEGQPVASGNEPSEEASFVSPGYFHTMGIPLIEGRDFALTDTPTSPDVVIINQAFAKRYFPNEDPVGKHMTPGFSDPDAPNAMPPMREIVGVVGDVKTRALSRDAKPEFFFLYQQALIGNLNMVLRTQAAPDSVVGAARDAIHSMDSNLPVYHVESLDQYVGASVAQPRFSTLLLSIFAGLALALTALGLYGVLSYSVARRTHEIGIRMALGAQTGDVLKMVVRQAMLLTLIGWAAGMTAGFALTQFLSSQLYGIRVTDPLTLLAVTIVLAVIALLASYIPARRAMSVDPLVALRYE
jgi:predicted permease